VKDSLISWGKYLRNELKFDGFRLDAVKPIDPAFMAAFLKEANGNSYAVAELWSNSADIGSWLNTAKNVNGAPLRCSIFLCDIHSKRCATIPGGFDMRSLDNAGLAGAGVSGFDYSTFVENHDFDRTGFDGSTDNGHDPVLTDKHLAYAYILFSEGRPCIFFKDYFTYGYSGKIDTLIWIRQNFLGGGTTKRNGLNAYYIREDNNQDQNTVSAPMSLLHEGMDSELKKGDISSSTTIRHSGSMSGSIRIFPSELRTRISQGTMRTRSLSVPHRAARRIG
jgi:alpha-amylase